MDTAQAGSERNIILLYESEVIYEKFKQVFGPRYEIFWGKDLNSTMDILGSRTVGVMVCDIHFHNQDIYPVVLALKAMHPELVTMIVTQSQDAKAVSELEAQDEIFAALVRPVTQEKLNQTLDNAFQYYLDHRKHIVEEIRAKEAAEEAETGGASPFAGMSLAEIISSRVNTQAGAGETLAITGSLPEALPDDILALEMPASEADSMPSDIQALGDLPLAQPAASSAPAADATQWLDELDAVFAEEPAAPAAAAGKEQKKDQLDIMFFEDIEYDDD